MCKCRGGEVPVQIGLSPPIVVSGKPTNPGPKQKRRISLRRQNTRGNTTQIPHVTKLPFMVAVLLKWQPLYLTLDLKGRPVIGLIMDQPTGFRLSHHTGRGRPLLAVRACSHHSFLGIHLGHINACPPSSLARVKSMISWVHQGFPSDHKTLPIIPKLV